MLIKNRYILLVFALILILLVNPGTCTAASSVTLSISPEVISVGDTVTVEVFVEPDVAIAGMQFDLEFDDTIVHVDDVTEGDLFSQSGMGTFFNNGSIEPGLLSNVYGTIMGASNVSTPAAFATITMVIDTADVGNLSLNLTNVIISDPTGHAVEVEVINATIDFSTIDFYSIYDVNMDGTVNDDDFIAVMLHFIETPSPACPRCDVNSDGIVNILDMRLVLLNYG